MKKLYLLKTMLLLCALVVGSSAWGDSYTITFKTGNGDGTSVSTSTACSTIVSAGNDYLSGDVVSANNSYHSGNYGLKLGKSGGEGTIKLNLASSITPSTIVVNAKRYNTSKTVTLSANDATGQTVSNSSNFNDYTFSIGSPISYIELKASQYCWINSITVNYASADTRTDVVTIGNINTSSVAFNATGTFTATLTPAEGIASSDYTVSWTPVSNNKLTLNADGSYTAGTIKGNVEVEIAVTPSESKSTNYKEVKKTFIVMVNNPNAGDGTRAKPFSVEEVREYIDESTNLTGKYVKGIITKIDQQITLGTATYWLSDDGQTLNRFEVYRGNSYNGEYFKTNKDLKVGDNVIVYGNLTLFNNSTYEFSSGSSIYSLNGVKTPEITFSAASYEVDYNGSLTIAATADASGVITYKSSNTTIAEINSTTGVVTPHQEGTVTITANIAASSDNIAGSKIVTLTVIDERVAAGISFTESTITKTWGETFTGQELTNTNSLPVSYDSSDPTVATVNPSAGTVSVLKAGTTVITANFVGNEDYKPAEISYTLTINKAAAGFSFEVTQFELMLNDDSFVAPTLQNPNNLPVIYASNDEDIALVDENTGEVILETSAEGSVTITASFTGNDYFNAGSASYTITISDPNKKGTKLNPYTVAEVISGTATGSGIYVKGFIVGEYVGKTTNPKTSSFTTDANIAIADELSNSPTAETSIPVQLGTDALKSAWGCKTTSGSLLGYEVLIKGNKDTYFSVNGIKNTSEVTALSMPVTVSSAKYATFSNARATDFSESGITVYTAKASGSVVKLTEVSDGIVPANTGVVLYNSSSVTKNVPFTTTNATLDDNELVGVTTATTVAKTDGSKFNYILEAGPVFKMAVEGGAILAAGKAYLSTSVDASASGARLSVVFDDDAQGIDATLNDNVEMINGVVFDLQGRRVTNAAKGLYIVDGKKVLVK